MAANSAKISVPDMIQAMNPTAPETTLAPMKRPKIARRMPPTTNTSTKPIASRLFMLSLPRGAEDAGGAGKGSPSMTPSMRSMPALMPP